MTSYLILDDLVHSKRKGKKMNGLGRHYSATEKKVVTSHCLFSGLYELLGRRCLLAPRLYRQQAAHEQREAPFQSKVDLAVAEIEAFAPVADTHTHVLIDSWYHCRRVRRAAQQRGWDISDGLKSNRKLRIRTADGTQQWVALSEYAAGLDEAAWTEALWPAQQGGRTVYVRAVRTWVRKLGPTLVLITRDSLTQLLAEARYWGSTLLTADAQTVINSRAIRWEIETLFENDKDLLGSDHYQVMSATAVVRFWTFIACLAYFLDKQRASMQAERPARPITWGDVRRGIQIEHRHSFLVWREAQIRAGVTVDQLSACA